MTQQEQSSTILQEQQANKYSFSNFEGNTQIVFYPHASGPIRAGQTPGASELEYQGEEGNFTFLGQQVEVQNSPLGSLINVVLKANNDTGGLTLTLILPPVNLAGEQQQTFETVAIKTKSSGNLRPMGASRTYEVLALQGVAENVILPL